MHKKLNVTSFQIIFYSFFGISTEIVFTAATDFKNQLLNGQISNWSLTGHTYVWMFPIYALIPILFPLGYNYIKKYALLLRLIIYAIGIFTIEFLSGWLLEMLTGKCPWEYASSLAVLGYIRLDYTPAWMLFGYILEQLHLFFTRLDLKQ
jgi:hypothetical protein